MKILALDLATKCGWAFWDGQRIESGVQDFSPKRGESSGMRYFYFNQWLNNIKCASHRQIQTEPFLDLVMYEQNFRRGGAASEVAAGFTTRVQEFCARYKIEYGQVNVATLKKWATGDGRASKEQMLGAVARYAAIPCSSGKAILDDNEADAILIACYAREQFGGNEWNAQPAAAGATK